MSEMQLSYEKLDVYQCAIQFLAVTEQLTSGFPRGNAALHDQLKRASLSIVLNIAEACGKPSPKDKERFFAIARGSAMESGAVLDACKILKLIDESLLVSGKKLIIRIVAMLSKMCR
jgi:four helix bundle protein